ncbi:MAG TPA: phosphoribosylamine--glycine ligase [Fimbriimonas sp.]|nr:phosphoribosylamine--glycine ligase [Fimbriimonas sp.]
MRILIVGGGAREHALAWKLSQEAEVLCSPGNPGIAEDVECLDVPATDAAGIADIVSGREVDLVVVGPEDPLIAGLSDQLRAQGITVYGPSAAAAQLEGSKAFSKDLMEAAGVPTAKYRSFTNSVEAKAYSRSRFDQGRAAVVKASGAASGKGVIVAVDADEADEAIESMMVAREFGDSGATVVVEDRLSGREFSLLTLVGENNFVSLPLAQDYKRVGEGDNGPNTGGMGSYSPLHGLPVGIVEELEKSVVEPILVEMKRRGTPFTGTLFSGLMMDDGVPHCLEFNVRFGDPETESLMLRLGGGLATALMQSAKGQFIEGPEVKPNSVVSVIVASGGYPGACAKGLPIRIGTLPAGAKLFHAGTSASEGQLVTNGGRVICASAEAGNLENARTLAYEAARAVDFEGAFFRRDIAGTP